MGTFRLLRVAILIATWVQIYCNFTCVLLERLSTVLVLQDLVVFILRQKLLIGLDLSDSTPLRWDTIASLPTFISDSLAPFFRFARPHSSCLLLVQELLASLVGLHVLLSVVVLLGLLLVLQFFQLAFDPFLFVDFSLQTGNFLPFFGLGLQLLLLLNRPRFLHFLLNLLDSFQLGSTALGSLPGHEPAHGG